MQKVKAKLAVLGVFVAAVAAFTASSRWLPAGHVREVVTILWMLVVPGYAAWRAIVKPEIMRLSAAVCGYILGLNLLLLMVIGLGLSQVYSFFGLSGPLNRTPLTYAVGAAVLVLGSVAAARATQLPKWPVPKWSSLKRFKPSLLSCLVVLSGLLLPVLAVAGAITLNNGGTAGLAIVGMFAAAALFLLLLMRERELGKYYGFILYCMCASILLATSMRGWNITGHDVMQEYQVFQLTLSHSAWHMNYYHDAYTACLSITILPTILQKISGVYAPYVFKFVFQLIAATIAVVLYGSLRPYAKQRTALLATFLFISFPTFLTDMSMLNRQEMGLLYFALVLHVGTTNKALGRRLRSSLVFLFMVGMILSHYSTSYVAIGALLVSLGAAYTWKYGAHVLRRKEVPQLSAFTSIASPVVLAASVLVLIGWGTIATQTSNNIQATIKSIVATAEGKSQPSGTLNQTSKNPTVKSFSQEALSSRVLPASDYYSKNVLAKYPAGAVPETVSPPSTLARALHFPASLLHTVYDLFRSGYELLIIGAFGIGLLYCLIKKRTKESLPRQYMLIAIGTLVLIALQVVFPAAINYGVTRMLQQALVVFALPSVLAALWALKLLRIPERFNEAILGGILALFFLVLTGAVPALTGGYKPSLTTANNGFYYAAYYTHQDEINASQWLEYDTPRGSRVYTDEFMRRKLITYGGIFSQPIILPNAVPIDSYVMLSHGDMEFNQVPAYDGGTPIYYQPPTAFLGQNKNLVYSSGDVQIYK